MTKSNNNNIVKKLKTLLKQIKKQENIYAKSIGGRAHEERVIMGNYIINRLDQLKLSQKKFAKKIGITQSQLDEFIMGQSPWDHDVYFRIKDGLGWADYFPFPHLVQ